MTKPGTGEEAIATGVRDWARAMTDDMATEDAAELEDSYVTIGAMLIAASMARGFVETDIARCEDAGQANVIITSTAELAAALAYQTRLEVKKLTQEMKDYEASHDESG